MTITDTIVDVLFAIPPVIYLITIVILLVFWIAMKSRKSASKNAANKAVEKDLQTTMLFDTLERIMHKHPASLNEANILLSGIASDLESEFRRYEGRPGPVKESITLRRAGGLPVTNFLDIRGVINDADDKQYFREVELHNLKIDAVQRLNLTEKFLQDILVKVNDGRVTNMELSKTINTQLLRIAHLGEEEPVKKPAPEPKKETKPSPESKKPETTSA